MLLCDDVEVMVRVYDEVLGFELRNKVAGRWAEFQVGGSLLAMRRAMSVILVEDRPVVGMGFRQGRRGGCARSRWCLGR